ncbi:MAG: M15 family metallopeptidase [Bacteroidetes bacterium]|nr:M15 family metallopeptidase [Bacteroidota bacterium]
MKKIVIVFLFISGITLAGYFVISNANNQVKIVPRAQINKINKQEPKIKESFPFDSILCSFPRPILPNDSLLKLHLLGKFDYTKDSFFTAVSAEHCTKPTYLQKETYKNFKAMFAAAKKEGVILKIISGTRNFNEQKAIWERKWETNIKTMDSIGAAKKILLYSSMPTTSRHHWGTDMDINSLENSYFQSGQGLKEYNWLKKNAAKYGFCQTYTDKKTVVRDGYQLEKWHWSYIPISSLYLKKYNELIDYSQIAGFKGSKLAEKLKSIEEYVNGIDKNCKICD